jgi:hypothetical protein
MQVGKPGETNVSESRGAENKTSAPTTNTEHFFHTRQLQNYPGKCICSLSLSLTYSHIPERCN